mmetsp:Transcript_877/g.2037  ORF Transcript_877/g.2037 Transcript_877/m.2037 type:complete len:275 (+) Transcript_877:1582-2406(+)
MLLDVLDKRNKEVALDAVLVKIIRCTVAGSNHDHATIKKCVKESADNHGISNISDLELVKAEHPSFLVKCIHAPLHHLITLESSLLQRVKHSVHLQHKLMKMDAPLAYNRQRIIQQMHRVCLAASGSSVQVQSLGSLYSGNLVELRFRSKLLSLCSFRSSSSCSSTFISCLSKQLLPPALRLSRLFGSCLRVSFNRLPPCSTPGVHPVTSHLFELHNVSMHTVKVRACNALRRVVADSACGDALLVQFAHGATGPKIHAIATAAEAASNDEHNA